MLCCVQLFEYILCCIKMFDTCRVELSCSIHAVLYSAVWYTVLFSCSMVVFSCLIRSIVVCSCLVYVFLYSLVFSPRAVPLLRLKESYIGNLMDYCLSWIELFIVLYFKMLFNILYFSHKMKFNLKLKFESEILKTFWVYSNFSIDIGRTPYKPLSRMILFDPFSPPSSIFH